MRKNVTLTFTIISIITMVITLIGATFSYFTTKVEIKNLDPVKIKSSKTGTATFESGGGIRLVVTGEDMASNNVNASLPVKTASNSSPIRATVTTTDDAPNITCKYKISYKPRVSYLKSVANLTNAKEFTIRGTEENGVLTIPETSLVDVTDEIVLLNNIEISAEGANTSFTHNWTFTVGYYNQAFNQDDHRDTSFGGNILLDKLDCIITT